MVQYTTEINLTNQQASVGLIKLKMEKDFMIQIH